MMSPQPPPIFGSLSLMTLNSSGLLTRVKKGKKEVTKLSIVLQHLAANSIDVAALQEPHIKSWEQYSLIHDRFDRQPGLPSQFQVRKPHMSVCPF